MSELIGGQWLLAVAVRSVIILLLASLIAFAFRRSSAAVVYRIWFLGLMGCLMLLVGSALPQWKLEVLPAEAVVLANNETVDPAFDNAALHPYRRFTEKHRLQAGGDDAVLATDTAEITRALVEAEQPEVMPEIASSPIVTTNAVSQGASNGAREVPTWSVLLTDAVLAVWCLGVLLFVVRYLWHWNAARALRRQSRDCDDDQWREVASQCGQKLQINRPVRLMQHSSGISPMVVGILRPVVLLPESSKEWDANRRILVLMHELSHIQRHDLSKQLVASIACAIYWFNPLAWLAHRQMKRLREIACDDAVIRQTAEPELYAEVLLSVALSQRQRPLAGAIAMARTSDVKDRIVCILDSARRRSSLTRGKAIVLLILAVAFSMLIGSGSLTSHAQESKPGIATTEEANPQATEAKKKQQRIFLRASRKRIPPVSSVCSSKIRRSLPRKLW